MRTVSLNFMKKMILVCGLIFATATLSMNAQEIMAFDNIQLSNEDGDETEVTNELSVDEQISETSANIGSWIENEVAARIGNYDIPTDKYLFNIELLVNKTGKIVSYKIGETKDYRINKLLVEILDNAPAFDAVKMNGYAAKMNYKLPVQILVK